MEVYDNNYRGPVYIERRTNGLGTAGFVLSLITFIFGWVPVFGWIIWILGLIFSFIRIHHLADRYHTHTVPVRGHSGRIWHSWYLHRPLHDALTPKK